MRARTVVDLAPMTDPAPETAPETGPDLDALLDDAKPSVLVPVGAGALALHGVLVLATGLQGAVVTGTAAGWVSFVPPVLLAAGAANILAAFAMAKFVPRVGWTAPFVAGTSTALAGGWFILASFLRVISPGAFVTAMFGLPSLLLVLVAQPAWHRCARARKAIKGELGAGATKSSGGGLVAIAVAMAIVVGGGLAVVAGLNVGDPLVLAVVRRGEIDSLADHRFAEDIGDNLARAGLIPAVLAHPLPADTELDAALAKARQEGAGHALVLDLDANVTRPGLVPGAQLYTLTLGASLASTKPGSDPLSFPTLEYAYESETPGSALYDASERWVEALNPWTLDALFQQDSFAPVLEFKVSSGKLDKANQLSQLKRGVQARRDQEQEWADWCSAEGDRLAAGGEAEPDVTCLPAACRAWYATGVAADGRIVVQEYSREPVFKIPPSVRPDWTEPPERVLLIDPDDPGNETELLTANNLYDLGKVDADGKFAIVEVFGADGVLGLVQLDLTKGGVAEVALLERWQRTDWLNPGLDGGPPVVGVRDVGTGLLWPDRGLDIPGLDRGLWTRTPDGPRVLGQSGEEARLYDEEGAASGRLKLEGRLRAAVPDGDSLHVFDEGYGACRVLEVDARTLRVRGTTELPLCLKRPKRLPDGRWVGLAAVSSGDDVPGDVELVLWDPAAEAILQLTVNDEKEETPHLTQDGRRVVFNRRLPDFPRQFDTKVYRRQICWTDVP